MKLPRQAGPPPIVSAEARDEFAAGLPERVERARRTLEQIESNFTREHAEALHAAALGLRGAAAQGGAQAVRDAAAQLETVAQSWIGRGTATDAEQRHARAALARVELLAGGYEAPKPSSHGAARSLPDRLALLEEIRFDSPPTDMRQLFAAALSLFERVLDFQYASVVLADDSGGTYSLRTLYDRAQGAVVERDDTFAISHGAIGTVIRSGTPTRVDVSAKHGIPADPGEPGSTLIVPLRLENRVIGTLVFSRPADAAYTDDDLGFAIIGARQIEVSLHVAQLLAATEAQRDQLDTLVDTSAAAVMLVNAERRVVRGNAAMAALLGVPRETLGNATLGDVGRLFARSFAAPESLDTQEQALAHNSALHDRVELIYPRPAVYERVVAPVPATDGAARAGWIIVYRDVSHEAAVERAKSQFVSLVSHELRTPVTAISTSLSLLGEKGGAVSDSARELLEIAQRNTDRLIGLVNDLLHVSPRGAGRMQLELAPLPLADVIRSSVEAVATFAREADVQVVVTPPAEPIAVLGMRERVEQVFVHLLANAVKFSRRGATVQVAWRREADAAVIEVADTGPGIPEDQREIIFEPFRQLDSSSTREHEGAGLGLTISRDIARAHGGELWVESEVGSGSRFFVRLPLAPLDVGAGASLTPARDPAAAPLVLIAHSDRDWQHLAQARAGAEGWRVVSTETGADTLEALRRDRADLVVLGLELSDTHGLEVLQQIQLDPALFDTPVVLAADVDARSLGDEGANGGSGIATTAEDVIDRARRLLNEPPRRVILVVEDDPLLRPALGKIVRRAGYACLTVANAREALDFVRTRVPDLVITDYRMPEMSGVAFLEELRTVPEAQRAPAIMLTGHLTPELVRQVSDLSAKLLSKPVEAADLVATIRQLL